MAGDSGGLDLSFLNKEEARQILHVLERDSRLKRAEKERISKIHKEDTTELPGVTGAWFEEIQRRKFQNETDASKMIKQPLAYRLRKAIKNDSAAVKPSAPQTSQVQKNGSPSILGGLRTPFASLFSSFRKPKRQLLTAPSPLPPQQLPPSRYDCFAPGRLTSSKVEEMAKTATCNSPLAANVTQKRCDAHQAEVMGDNSSTWNEQLEKELLRVLGSLDEQLAQEQAQGPTADYGSRTSDNKQYPTVTGQSFRRGVQGNNHSRSMFLPDGTRTLRTREEHKHLFRQRTLYEKYMKKYHVEDCAHQDVSDRRSPVPKQWCSTRSLGHASEGSLEHLSGLRGSGFRYRDFPCTDTVSRSYSLSSLSRRQSSGSADQLSTESLQHPLAAEGKGRFMQRNYRHHSKRTPLSSVVWNVPPSSERQLDQDRIPRTQSLMEFGLKFEDTHHSPLDSTKYEFYRSRGSYRRSAPNSSLSSKVGCPDQLTDPLCHDNWGNYALRQPERNITSPRKYSSLRGRTHFFNKRFFSGKMEGQLLRPDRNQCNSDEPFLASEVDFERMPTNLGDCAHARNIGLRQCESDAQNNVLEHLRKTDRLEGETAEKFLKGIDNCPRYTLKSPLPFIRARASNIPVQARYTTQKQNMFTRANQTLIQPLVIHTQSKEDFQTLASEELGDTGQSSRAVNGDLKEGTPGPFSGEMDTNPPTESPPKNPSVAVPQTGTSLKPPLSLGSNMQATAAFSRDPEKNYISSTQNRSGQNKENERASNRALDHIFPTWLLGNRTRNSLFQSTQQGTRQPESLRLSLHRKQHENVCSPSFGRAWEAFERDELSDFCTEKSNKHSSFARPATSNSIPGSPSNTPPQSSVMYYSLHRKSASVDGSVISQKPLSSPKGRVPLRNQAPMEGNLETLATSRNERSSWNQTDRTAFVIPAHPLLLKDVTYEGNVPQTDGHRLLVAQEPDHTLSATNKIVRKSEKSTIIRGPDKKETSVLSNYEELDEGNSLQKCKTTSMVTVSVDEDNIKYHELISVYYTLPRKHSRMLHNLFQDDSSDVGSSSSPPTEQSSSTKYVHAGLEAVGFPSNLGKVDLPAKTSAGPGILRSSEIPDKGNEEGSQDRKPIWVLHPVPHSQLRKSNRKEAAEHVMVPQALSGNKPVSLSTPNLNIPLRNIAPMPSIPNTRNAPKESLLGCQPGDESPLRNNPHILSSCSSDGKNRHCASDLTANAPETSTEEQIRRDAKVKQRARHICHILALRGKKENRLQPRNESVTSGVDETVTSETTVQLHPENQTLPMEADAAVSPSLQPNIPVARVLESPKTKREQMLQHNPVHTIYTSSQISVSNTADNQNLNLENQPPNTTSDLHDGSTTENDLPLDNTQDKGSEMEQRRKRPSVKNKLAAMRKTSRKISGKKNLNPKPHVSSIFSQNDIPSSEFNESPLVSSVAPQSLQQLGNENQNQNPLPAELRDTMFGNAENKKSQAHEGLPLVTSENRRPFTNLCNQKRETQRHSDKQVENPIPHCTGLCEKDGESTLNNNSQACDESPENSNCPIISTVAAGDPSEKKKDVTAIGESSFFPPPSDKNSNNHTKNYSKANICPQQKAVPYTEYDHSQNAKHLRSLKRQNLPPAKPIPSKLRERHFSESSYTQDPYNTLAPKSHLFCQNRRKFNSYSELLSCDENENWEAYNDSNRTFGSRPLMYPSVEFGIFGKEQQQAFLDNIKRSLTEGRLWRPCLLKNPSFLRKEEGFSVNRTELSTSSFAEGNKPPEGTSEREPIEACEASPVDNSDSDSDTTTDDEYYPNEYDKESEL